MSKSVLTIEKEIEKKKYAESPLGQLEKKLRAFYDGLVTTGKKLPEDIAKEVSDHRENHEKGYMEFVEKRAAEDKVKINEDRIAVDKMLEGAFIKELEILKKYNGN